MQMDLPQVRRCAKHLACQAKLSLKLEGGVIKSVRRGIATLKGLRQLGRDISCEVEESSGWNRNYRPQQSGGSGTVYCFSSCRDDQTCVEYEGIMPFTMGSIAAVRQACHTNVHSLCAINHAS